MPRRAFSDDTPTARCTHCKSEFIDEFRQSPIDGKFVQRHRFCPDCRGEMGGRSDAEMDVYSYIQRNPGRRLRDGYSLMGFE